MTLRLLNAAALFGILGATVGALAEPTVYETPVRVRVIDQFKIGSDETRFGPLEFAGGLELTSKQSHFGAISGFVFVDGQNGFAAVADTGFWLRGRIERDAIDYAPTALSDVTMATIADETGNSVTDKWLADAEGLAKGMNGALLISFEREHRIETHRLAPDQFYRLVDTRKPPVDPRELRYNRGFEGIDVAPTTSALAGRLVGISEKSLDANRNIMAFAAGQNGDHFEFSVMRDGEFDVTDMAFLPDGDLVILERRFTVQNGVGMRLRLIADETIVSGATVQPLTLYEADMSHQIDNMEALAVSVDPDGTPRLTLLSDDNHSILQRNLLLEFRLVEGASSLASPS